MTKTLTGTWVAALLTLATMAAADAAVATLDLQGSAYFTLRQERPGMADDQYFETSTFVLPPGADIDPAHEAVAIELATPTCGGVFSRLEFPAGSFELRGGGKIAFFDGVVTDTFTGKDTLVSVRVTRDRGFFKLALDFKDADYTCLEGTADVEVTTTATIGDDTLQTPPTCFERLNDGDLWWPPPYIGGVTC